MLHQLLQNIAAQLVERPEQSIADHLLPTQTVLARRELRRAARLRCLAEPVHRLQTRSTTSLHRTSSSSALIGNGPLFLSFSLLFLPCSICMTLPQMYGRSCSSYLALGSPIVGHRVRSRVWLQTHSFFRHAEVASRTHL